MGALNSIGSFGLTSRIRLHLNVISPKKTRSELSGIQRCKTAGFALIASISIMAVVLLLVVALFSLSSVETQSASVAAARTEAQANARMALMMAIGELQSQLGPDQRISANASIMDSSPEDTAVQGVANPHWLGVWDSWIAGVLTEASVNPNYPSAASEHSTIGDPKDLSLQEGMHPRYEQKNNHFRAWLTSLNPTQMNFDSAQQLTINGDVKPQGDSEAVRLVGNGSLGPDADTLDYVNAGLIEIENNLTQFRGRFGWWVGDENQKAKILSDSYDLESNLSDADKIYRTQAPAAMGTERLPGFSDISDPTQLNKVASFESLDLLNLNTTPTPDTPKLSQRNFHHATRSSFGVLADVREGGLKRDLSTLLERPINLPADDEELSDDEDAFMLYAFDDPRFPGERTNSRVPIQDLSAYYQLYNDIEATDPEFGVAGREGVRYNSSELASSTQLRVPDYDGGVGDAEDRKYLLREYTSLYRQPVVTKIQFLLGITAEEITAEERAFVQQQVDDGINRTYDAVLPIPAEDTHKLLVGMMPVVTLWNPTNVPLVMDESQVIRVMTPPNIIFSWRKYDGGATNTKDSPAPTQLRFFTGGEQVWQMDGRTSGYDFFIYRLEGENSSPVVFKPGEVKMFSLDDRFGSLLTEDGKSGRIGGEYVHQSENAIFDPYRFFKCWHSTTFIRPEEENPHIYIFNLNGRQCTYTFNANDRFSFWIDHDDSDSGHYAYTRAVARNSSMAGSFFAFSLVDETFYRNWEETRFLNHHVTLSRHGASNQEVNKAMALFNEEMITPGFPGGVTPIEHLDYLNAIQGRDLIGAANAGEIKGLMEFSLNLGVEAGPTTGGLGGGRRIASRPFLHSGVGAPVFMDYSDPAWLYQYGYNWELRMINDVEDSSFQGDPGTDNGYFGGGYTTEAGTTHVIQREIPVLPPISIASLSNAQLGGYSLAQAVNYYDLDPVSGTRSHKDWDRAPGKPALTDFQMTTATGQAGLAPLVTQAIGNSYAHPGLLETEAFTVKTRFFDADEGPVDDIPFVDHSYLANKALWDDYFFSSISPQPAKVPLFGNSGRSAQDVAEDFFFDGDLLPNRRMAINPFSIPDADELNTLFADAGRFTDGLADKIASHLMVDGAFNINSTSVEAWKSFLSSLRGNPVPYLDGGISPQLANSSGTPLGSGILPNARPILTEDISGPNLPAEQWLTGRILTDTEIDELANAIVKQVKLRGPFLSLSEFINRRLETYSEEAPHALKGALQAALDDPSVSINAKFREDRRMLDSETSVISDFDFPEAALGPIAYGSMPYMDQADVLKHFSGQLTPRGDTFVIRAYADSTNQDGNVVARVWCEAVVQRVPEYCDTSDDPHEPVSELTELNRNFGRQFKIINFRWLDEDEV